MGANRQEHRIAGYSFLISKYSISTFPLKHISRISFQSERRTLTNGDVTEDIYPHKYWPGDSTGNHLEFALKYDGVDLLCLNLIFDAAGKDEIIDYISSKPTGKYSRRIWFFYEFFKGVRLPLNDLDSGNYIEALDSGFYYSVSPGARSPRHRVVNNLPGNKDFCPSVRKTEKLKKFESAELNKLCENVLRSYPPELLKRALSYFYNKETKSSFEIENIKPGFSRTERFISLLETAGQEDFCSEKKLIELQNKTVDPRFADKGYRSTQNYVGQTVSYQKEIVHYISPKPDDLLSMMKGLEAAHLNMTKGKVPAVVHAGIISYGFVFLHPFEDGNGRIHRFLIHNILSLRGLVPAGLMFPVSAVILKNPADYNDSLESFSKKIMKLTEYSLDERGVMTVLNSTDKFYRFADMTVQTEYLYDFVVRTIENELTEELDFLVNYDRAKIALKDIIDMPDRLIDLFIQLCLQNDGSISLNKRKKHFDFLTDDELSAMETAVGEIYKLKLTTERI
ncbi:MAG TPA: Fic family protein [Clostridiales bacterium]|nr:Fic family protein [Clostridiales bacterium]